VRPPRPGVRLARSRVQPPTAPVFASLDTKAEWPQAATCVAKDLAQGLCTVSPDMPPDQRRNPRSNRAYAVVSACAGLVSDNGGDGGSGGRRSGAGDRNAPGR
jgi:hypothetical protein